MTTANWTYQPVRNHNVRHHEMTVYLHDNDNIALYCHKCGKTIRVFGGIRNLSIINEWAREHRAGAKVGGDYVNHDNDNG